MKYVFDYESMTELLNNFYNLTAARYCLYDVNFNIICSCGEDTQFCDMITKKKKDHMLCREDDQKHFRQIAQNSSPHTPYIYRCHCGVINVLYPIYDDNLCGYILFGQILDDSSIEDQWQLALLGLSENSESSISAYREAFFHLPRYSSRQILSTAKLLEACASYIKIRGLTPPVYQSDEEQLISIIHKKFAEPLTLDYIAKEMCISKSKLCGIATKQNTTVFSMINEYRVRIAAETLACSNRSIAEIAQSVGISDYNYFTRLFKKITGSTPSDYRNKINRHRQ